MSDITRYDVIYFKEGKGGKTYAVRLGSATPGKKPNTMNLWLDAIPAPVEGQYKLSVVPPRDKPQGAQTGSQGPADMGDEIPFAPEFR